MSSSINLLEINFSPDSLENRLETFDRIVDDLKVMTNPNAARVLFAVAAFLGLKPG